MTEQICKPGALKDRGDLDSGRPVGLRGRLEGTLGTGCGDALGSVLEVVGGVFLAEFGGGADQDRGGDSTRGRLGTPSRASPSRAR